jgi:hypothetical protein
MYITQLQQYEEQGKQPGKVGDTAVLQVLQVTHTPKRNKVRM